MDLSAVMELLGYSLCAWRTCELCQVESKKEKLGKGTDSV
jgi:hypothetical protein